MSAETEAIGQAADHLLLLPYETWTYGDSVGFEAMLAASDAIGDARFAAFAHGFFRAWASRAEPYRDLDHTAPGLAMVLVAERTGDSHLLEAVVRLADYLLKRRKLHAVFETWARSPLRQPYGPNRLSPGETALLCDPGAGVFVDCLHFDPPFFAALGTLTGESRFIDAAIEQALGYVALLQDPVTGLFHHFWLEKTVSPHILGWGRGQGWALLGLLDVLEHGGAFEQRVEIVDSVQRLAEAMRSFQREDGHWHAVVQDSGSGDESSTAAFMAAGFRRGRRLGVLDEAFDASANRALAAARAATSDTGMLTGVSAAVWACTLPSHYAHVPRGFLVPWGQGPLVLALAEAAHDAVPSNGRAGGS